MTSGGDAMLPSCRDAPRSCPPSPIRAANGTKTLQIAPVWTSKSIRSTTIIIFSLHGELTQRDGRPHTHTHTSITQRHVDKSLRTSLIIAFPAPENLCPLLHGLHALAVRLGGSATPVELLSPGLGGRAARLLLLPCPRTLR